MSGRSLRSHVRAWRPDLPGVAEVFHATFVDHAYPPHCHDVWTVLLIDRGAVRYDLNGRDRSAAVGDVTILPPFVAHDGSSARPGRGFRKRVLYIDGSLIAEDLVGRAVDHPTLWDAQLRVAVAQLHDALERPRDDLEWESRLALVMAQIRVHLGKRPAAVAQATAPATALRDFLDARPTQRHKLDQVAAELGWNPTHLVRSFTASFGLPPHRYLVSRRIDEARRRLLDGQPPKDVAVAVGFYDQAHLTRHFKAHLATTPSAYQRSTRRL